MHIVPAKNGYLQPSINDNMPQKDGYFSLSLAFKAKRVQEKSIA
jgi:hypothetical protein